LTPQQERWNYYHSLTRGVIEKTFGIMKSRNRWALKGVQFQSAETYADHYIVACILHNMCTAHRESLSHAQLLAEPPMLLAHDDDDERCMGLLARSESHFAWQARLARYYEEEMANILAMEEESTVVGTRRRRADIRVDSTQGGPAAVDVGVSIPGGAADDPLNGVVQDIEDEQTGKDLRMRVFDEMAMNLWEPSSQRFGAGNEDARARARQRRP